MKHASLIVLVLLASQALVSRARAPECGITPQQEAVTEALDAAVKETGAKPLEIIQLGLEKFRENKNPEVVRAASIPQKIEHQQQSPDDLDKDEEDSGLKSLFNEDNNDQQQQHHHHDDDLGLKSLFDEGAHPGDQSQAQTGDDKSENRPLTDRDEEFGLNSLFEEEHPSVEETRKTPRPRKVFNKLSPNIRSPISSKPVADEEPELGIKSLFQEAASQQSSPSQGPVPSQVGEFTDHKPEENFWSQSEHEGFNSGVPAEEETIETPVGEKSDSHSNLLMLPALRPEHDDKRQEAEQQAKPVEEFKPQTKEPKQTEEPIKPAQEPKQVEEGTKPTSEPLRLDSSAQYRGNKPVNEHFVDSFIDNSDPKDPKKVHIEREIKSHVDPSGAVNHMHAETHTSSSLNGNKSPNRNHRKHSSHSSTSYSYSSSSSGGRPPKYNGKQVQVPAISRMPPLPPMAPMVLMPMVPFGAPPTWPGFYNPHQPISKRQQRRQQQQQFPFATAFAGAGYPGAPAAFAGAHPGYPGAPAAFAGAHPGYPGAPAAFAGAHPGYPGAPAAFAGAHAGFPGAEGAFASASAAPYYGAEDEDKAARRRAKNAKKRAKKAQRNAKKVAAVQQH